MVHNNFQRIYSIHNAQITVTCKFEKNLFQNIYNTKTLIRNTCFKESCDSNQRLFLLSVMYENKIRWSINISKNEHLLNISKRFVVHCSALKNIKTSCYNERSCVCVVRHSGFFIKALGKRSRRASANHSSLLCPGLCPSSCLCLSLLSK